MANLSVRIVNTRVRLREDWSLRVRVEKVDPGPAGVRIGVRWENGSFDWRREIEVEAIAG